MLGASFIRMISFIDQCPMALALSVGGTVIDPVEPLPSPSEVILCRRLLGLFWNILPEVTGESQGLKID